MLKTSLILCCPQIGDAKIYLLNSRGEVISKTQIPIWDVPIGWEVPKKEVGEEGASTEGEYETEWRR